MRFWSQSRKRLSSPCVVSAECRGPVFVLLAEQEDLIAIARPRHAALSPEIREQQAQWWIDAAGLRADYSWLHVPVLDRKGRIRHDGGVVDVRGLSALGLPFLRRRKWSFMDSAEDGALGLCAQLAGHLDRLYARSAVSVSCCSGSEGRASAPLGR